MKHDIRCKLMDFGETYQKIQFVSVISTEQPVVTVSGGTVSVSQMSDRYNYNGKIIATCTITITGLQPFTYYEYTVLQAGKTISNKFRTAPTKNDRFSFIIKSCDHPYNNYSQNPWKLIRKLKDDRDFPLAAMFHIDDVSYVDSTVVNDSDRGIATTGEPQLTGLGRDYAANWAVYYGMVAGGGTRSATEKWTNPDKIYLDETVPELCSGGDHAIENNHCRGALVNGVPNADYGGCNRGPTDPVPNLEAIAKAEWDAFFGNSGPAPLRAGKLHWGIQIGDAKFGLFDYSMYSDPYDSVLNPDPQGYSAEQITDIMTYLDDENVSFKFLLMESPPTTFGQPWKNWHETEAAAWKADLDSTPTMNGTTGSATCLCGDNHALYCTKYDTFWNFCGGCFNGTAVVNYAMEDSGSVQNVTASWNGQNQFNQHGYEITGDRHIGGFWLFRVTPGVKVEAQCYSGSGVAYPEKYTLYKNTTSNQWVRNRAKLG